jgi:two-component system CheB/CheR fusion protein
VNKKVPKTIKDKKPIHRKQSKSFPVIAIGASAGGLEAFEGFFSHMPSDSNIAFVVIQHLDPTHKSIMGSLLAKHTKMKVLEAEDGMGVHPNCIYLNPPNKKMLIINRTLQLVELDKPHAANLPIDYFFRSLSEDQAEKAICIILSGTGTDGTLGAKAIKGAGGMIMVQEENQAKYNGMPRSAIDTGLIDYILPVEKMPEELIKYIRHPYIVADEMVGITKQQFQNYLQKIFILIRSQTGHDFSNYKQNTIRRRIERRMAVHQIKNIADYVRYIKQTPGEVEILFKDLLITVTNFFRDPEAFDVLKDGAIPELLAEVPADSSLRCWVPGCATGEEAYSIAMLLVEALQENENHIKIQVFATDIDEDAIEFARLGVYPDSIAADVSAERLKRFYIKDDNSYKIKKQIRDMVVFATQNLIKDPPFSKLHIISCRNLLIYMDQVLQKKILPLFHYTLNQNGILFLGSSESIGEFSDLFIPVDNKWKIFKRQGDLFKRDVYYHTIPFHDQVVPHPKSDAQKVIREIDIRGLVQKVILEDYSPPCVLINEKYEILYFSGDTDKYLMPPVGEPNFNILEMAREDIRYKISTALRKAIKQKSSVLIENLRIKHNNSYLNVDVAIQPITERKDRQGLIMVVFNDKTLQNKNVKKEKNDLKNKEESHRISALKQELNSTKEYLQTTIEELETTNEELKSANEELQSTNEELQSTNEELETSKEELQSTNEELITVNAELQNKVNELNRANNDINNLLASTEIGTIFLDKQLRIKRFTPELTKFFNLILSDIERPISDITATITYDGLVEDAKKVLSTLTRKEVEIQNKDNNWYSMRIAPYRTTENVIDGVVITFIDITKIKHAEAQYRRIAAVVQDANDAFTVQKLDGTIVAWNKGAEEMYGYSESEALQMNIKEIIPDQKKKEILRIIEQLKKGKNVSPFVTERKAKDGCILKVRLTVTKLIDDSGAISFIATSERDISGFEEKMGLKLG